MWKTENIPSNSNSRSNSLSMQILYFFMTKKEFCNSVYFLKYMKNEIYLNFCAKESFSPDNFAAI